MKKTLYAGILFFIFVCPGAFAQKARFLDLWNAIHDPANGYFSPEGIPYYAVETCLVESVDQGHETTSEEFAYWIMLELMYAKETGVLSPFIKAWDKMEKYMIPAEQPGNDRYNPLDPSVYTPEPDTLQSYPARPLCDFPVGIDPVSASLQAAYGNKIYAMHWLLDSDDFYEFGKGKRPVFINTHRRGRLESVWETIPHPAVDDLSRGGINGMGFEPLFTYNSAYFPSWRYTSVPAAEAGVIQALFLGYCAGLEMAPYIARAAEMGDWLRLSFFDKYFRTIGASTNESTAGTGYDSCHYLISRKYSWGGGLSGSWAWRTGGSCCHIGEQNPLTAWVCSGHSPAGQAFTGSAENAARDWEISLYRQLAFYEWLQTGNGLFAGGAVSSWKGRYAQPPAGQAVFYNMFYDAAPGFGEPGAGSWFGWQAKAAVRLAEYYYFSGDSRAKVILAKWVDFCKAEIVLTGSNDFEIPETLAFTGQPGAGLNASVVSRNKDIGTASALARSLIYYGIKANDYYAVELAHNLLDNMWNGWKNRKGINSPNPRPDYIRFLDQEVYVPSGMSGVMGNGDPVRQGIGFLDIRSKYRKDSYFKSEVLPALKAGKVPVPAYYRFRDQVEAALAFAVYDYQPEKTPAPTPSATPTLRGTFTATPVSSGPYRVFTPRDSYTVPVNTIFTTPIHVETGDAALAAYGMSFTYDPEAISVVKLEQGDFRMPPIYNIENPGVINVAAFDITGKFGKVLLKITWKAGAESSQSLLNINVDNLTDPEFHELGTAGRGAVITVISNAIGDVNDDGKITVIDALMTVQYTVGLKSSAPGGDADCNGVINIVDALMIAQHSVGLAVHLGCLE